MEKEVEEIGEARAHWRRRILPEMPADMRRSDEEFRSPRCVSCDEAKGREEMGSWGFYRGSNLQRGLGYRARLNGGGEHRAGKGERGRRWAIIGGDLFLF
jgi:hypothetical protein